MIISAQRYYNILELPNCVIITFVLSIAKKRETEEMGPTKKQFLSSAQVHSADYGFAALGWQRNPWGRRLIPFIAREQPKTPHFCCRKE
jgi:hypothetical protein